MKKYDYVIVGGGIAGTSAADTIRKNDLKGSIAIISDEPHRLYSRILLSKPSWFLGKISHDKVWLKQESWYADNKIEFIGGEKIVKIDSEKKKAISEAGNEYEYNKLLLATGVCARSWGIKGADRKGVYAVRTLEDAEGILKTAKKAKKAVAIGGGFISFELAALLVEKNIEVSIVIRRSYYWEPILDKFGGSVIEKAMKEKGVEVIHNNEVVEVLGNKKVEGVLLKDGTKIDCDLIICGIGVTCPTDWLEVSGIESNKGIIADEYLKTNQPDIWVAGDAAEYKDLLLGEVVQLGNWGHAQKQGQHAGMNMTGEQTPYKFVSFYTVTGFGSTIAFVGDVRPLDDREIITRGAVKNSVTRIIVKDGQVIGGTMVNKNSEMGALQQLIQKNVDVSGKLKELADPEFDLKTLFE